MSYFSALDIEKLSICAQKLGFFSIDLSLLGEFSNKIIDKTFLDKNNYNEDKALICGYYVVLFYFVLYASFFKNFKITKKIVINELFKELDEKETKDYITLNEYIKKQTWMIVSLSVIEN